MHEMHLTIKEDFIIRWHFVLTYIRYIMNEIVNRFLLTGDEFMPEMHSKPSGSTYSACEPFTKNRERYKLYL